MNSYMRAAPSEAGPDPGFTLIELMVVVLIIAVLLAIAIPTFLGARQRANDRAVQSNLRNAHTNELTFYSDRQKFTEDPAEMHALDASLDYTMALVDLQSATRVILLDASTTSSTDDTIVLGGRSNSGRCFWLRTVGNQNLPRFARNDCSSVPSGASFVDEW
ncbi:MAG TPA: prepilin-type N-terminal cleavage/methylation domain-containing protein [Acidimicrobiales bacterium]|nr:prepilin-type N-terminal cleavage/methylation domain-containing protein [Acidimicrobiales bacterium]